MRAKKVVPPGDAEAILDAFGVEALCDALVGGEPQRSICKRLNVSQGSLRRWIALDAERQARVHEARVEAASAWDEKAEEVIIKARGKDGISKARELAHHYRWRASKADPRRYGDRLAVGGSDDMPPIDHSLTVRFVTPG